MNLTRSFVAIVAGVLGVSLALAEGGAEAEELTGPFPVIERPTGDFPVGHWDCWYEHWNFDKIAKHSGGWEPIRCAVALFYSATVLDLQPDGIGWMLAVRTPDSTNQDFDPDAAFRIQGSDKLHSRAGELRWRIQADGEMHIQTTINEWFTYTPLTENVFRLQYWSNPAKDPTNRLLFRLGTPEARAMEDFRDCVMANEGKNIFDVVPCTNPIPGLSRTDKPSS